MTDLALYVPSASFEAVKNPFGKDTANLGLFQALAEHGGFGELTVLAPEAVPIASLSGPLLRGRPSKTRLNAGSIHDTGLAARAGALLRGKADLADLAWLRRAAGDRAYSLVGLVHTLAPPAIREYIAAASLAPVQPWDALICTSPAVRDALDTLFEEYGAFLADRFGGTARPKPQLPLIPLGVEGATLAAQADRSDVRASLRQRLGLSEDDVLVLWLGRLSFFEKAYPQPMFRAIHEARARSGKRLCFAMAGWFPNGEVGRSLYEEAARAYAPEMPLFILDGNDRGLVEGLWAASDIFLSLVDNIQETFGLTPLEAMAAGLPVVASDWDGYRYTMRHGEEAYLARTLGGPAGSAGRLMSARHVLGIEAYQAYVGTVAQFTAVDVDQAADGLARLAADPDLRRRMGRAGRERVRTMFDWPVVAAEVRRLIENLAAERKAAAPFGVGVGPETSPVKGDPFADFALFANAVLSPALRVALCPGASIEAVQAELARSAGVRLDGFAANWRANQGECRALIDHIGAHGPVSVGDIEARVPAQRREAVRLALVWLCKLGLLAWDAPGSSS
ncbi:glycosyltransferase family 4 protein [Methylobacterium sp. A54F]